MASDRSSLTTSEVDAMLVATASSRLHNGKNKVTHLGNVRTPTLNIMRAAARANATPVRGAYKAHLANPRGARMQSVSGRDIHTFSSVDTLFDIEFSVGRVHLGDEWVHQQLDEAGVSIDYSDQVYQTIDVTKAGWWKKGADTFEVLVNLAEQKLTALELNYIQELNKNFWRANTADPKMWVGMDGALSRTSNTTGPIGNRTRSMSTLRHQLQASVAAADLELKLNQLRRACNKRTQDGTSVGYTVCGENVYDMIVQKMFSGSTGITSPRLTRDYDNARAEAQARAQKLGVGFPDDAIYIAGVGILCIEPAFEDLDREDAPATLWQNSLIMLNLDHITFKPTKGKDGNMKVHATPYNQHVTRISAYGEYALVLDKIDCHGVLTISGS
jgi:hypothetical protein